MNRYLSTIVLLFSLLVLLAGCGDTETTATSLSVTPTSSEVTAGTAPVTFKATLTNTSGEVSWKLSPNLGTLSSTTGLEITYTPPVTLPAPTIVTLTASLGNLTAKATVTLNPAPGFTVTGKVQGYSAGTASLEAITIESDSVPPIKVGTIEADGSFSITLPEVLENKDLTLETDSPCSEVTQTPASYKTAQLSTLLVVKDNLRIGELEHASSLDFFGSSRVTYVYVDQDVSITGTCHEEADNFSYIYNTNFKKGWNLGLSVFGETSFSFTTPENVDLPWLFSPTFPEDTTPPTVISIDPPDGTKGVIEDASIVITFSEKMDRTATQDAFQRSANFPDAGVTYSWNAEDTVLTVKPNDLLEYAAGENPSIAAETYTFSFSETAKDVAGNSLAAFSSSFTTLKVIATSIYGMADLDGHVNDAGEVNSVENYFIVGDIATGGGTFRGFVSFDLTSIPTGVSADEAKLIINKQEITNNPYELSSVSLDHVNYGASLSGNDYDTPMLADLGVFDSSSAPATGYVSSDVTSGVNDDLANRDERGNRSQFRLRFPSLSSNAASDFVSFTASEGPNGLRPFLNVVYYLP